MSLYRKVLEKMKKINCIQKERGAIFVLTAVLLPIMFGCLGIAYDVGNIYIHKARLQNVTDAAALAGGRAYLQSQTKTNANDRDSIDDDTNGKAEREYVIGGSHTQSGNHQDADAAADAYIFKNIINLGEKVYSDKYSHYALKGIKKSGDNYIAADEIFYRIGLSETVRLYFLPVLTNRRFETVRAGSVVVVEPGTTTVIPGTGGGTTTVTNPSIFDNLFTYSETFSAAPVYVHSQGEGNVNIEAIAAYQGTIAYTYENDPQSYYDTTGQNGGSTSYFNHLYENKADGDNRIYSSNDIRSKDINDPILQTYYSITDYADALKASLNKVHVEYDNSQNLNFTNDDMKITKYIITASGHAGNYVKCQGDYYPFNESTGDYIYVQDSNGSKYMICYHMSTTYWAYLRCAKKVGDDDKTRYYMLDKDGKIADCFITNNSSSEVWYGTQNNLYDRLDQNAFNNAQKQTITNFVSNVIHVHNGNYGRVPNLTIKVHDGMPGNSNSPIYVIVESDVGMCKIEGSNNDIPVIIVYLGTGQTTLDLGDGTFKGTIYAPYTKVPIQNYHGTFYGNIIAKEIESQGSNKGTWIQTNFLENYNYSGTNTYTDENVKAVTETIEQKIRDANAKLTDALKEEIATTLGIEPDKLGNTSWYQQQTYADKQIYYGKWKTLYNKYDDPAIRNILWPWNEFFDIEAGEDQIVTTDENLRLINYRTEYQVNEDGSVPENKVLDPFIFETLAKPNSY